MQYKFSNHMPKCKRNDRFLGKSRIEQKTFLLKLNYKAYFSSRRYTITIMYKAKVCLNTKSNINTTYFVKVDVEWWEGEERTNLR